MLHSYPGSSRHFNFTIWQIDLRQDNIDLDIQLNDEIPGLL